jgi:phage-related protein (TIGR01555 family)
MAWITDSLTSAIAFASRLNPFGRLGGAGCDLPGAFTHQLAIAAYMSSGMLRKVIAIPAADRTQKWRDWQTDKDTIKLIETEEKRLGLQAKTKECERLRGIGGGAMILITAGDHSQPLKPDMIAKGGLIAINVVSRWQIRGEDFVRELTDPMYGQPRMWVMDGDGKQAKIHPSRVVCYRGDALPAGAAVSDEERFWGDSRLLRVFREVETSDNAQVWFAALIRKAKLLRVGIPDLLDLVETAEGRARLDQRIALIATGESSLNATVYRSGTGPDDPGEKIDDYQITWAGIPAMMDAFNQQVAAVSDIPFTRLMGRSPAGMNATGEHDTDNWNDAVSDGQENETRPCLEQIDPVLLRSAGVAKPDEVTWRWAPLWTPTEQEEAATFKTTMEAVDLLQGTGAIPDRAFAEGLQNLMEEREYMPGLGTALAKLSEQERFGLPGGEDDGADPSELTETTNGGKEAIQTSAGGGANPPEQRSARRAANDAAPRTLYVRRDVVNVAELKAWARAQGLPALQEGLYVTLAYSRTPIDWMKIDGEWNQDAKGEITIQPGGVRIVEPLGDRTAVLLFTSSALSWRHESIIRSGASHDYDDYQPHISLTGEPVDLTNVEPYRGKIVLGPEIFEDLDETR